MSGVMGNDQDADIDLGRLFSAVWQRRGRLLAATALAAGLAFVATTIMAPSFRGEARILIESRSPNLSAGQTPASGNDPVLDTLNITSQAEVLQSSDLIKQVARDLRLHEIAEFDPDGHSLFPGPFVLLGLAQDPLSVAPEERVVREFREKLKVYPIENSRIIAIEFSSHDPKLAAAIPNKMAQVYLALESGAKLDTQSDTAKWLEPEITALTEKVREAERKVADYRSEAGLFQTAQSGSFAAQQLNDISNELARVRGERANAEARAQNVRAALDAGRASDTLTDVVGSQVIQRLKETEANLQAQISDQSTVLLENHPRLKGLRAQLQGIRRQIEAETQKILASLDNEAEVSRLRETQLIQQLNTIKADSARTGEDEVGLRALEREAAAQRQLLETYLARYREAASRQEPGAAPADARIVSTAIEPQEPYFPKVVPIVIVVSLATFVMGAIAVMLGELFSGRALRPSQAAPGIEPEVRDEADEHLVHRMQADAAAEFDQIHARLQNEQPAPAEEPSEADPAVPGPNAEDSDEVFNIETVANYLTRYDVSVALAVSPQGDKGSTATVMLARDISDRGKTVVLIDMTGSACPSRLMGAGTLPGVTDLLCGEAAFGEAIHGDRLSDAHIVPQGNADAVAAMRGIDRLSMIIDALADAYDHVLVECGAADVEGVSRLSRGRDAEIIFSIADAHSESFSATLDGYRNAGFDNLLVMASDATVPSGRRAA
ncbi:putative transmembrane succinoglycan biosynthesis transport protein [Pseudorhizobium banfieldiae]|uniref:Putative transmembrane succinoglycan biosynthesis transport protein n=1 Tax=Pseudorhizobium banfieldiae TaxID=1125847 RepID=L0ND14_9HYPH|nr:Wzz/FepE/Etk N-terminal domain-containing protein [Pseudorhizobium banfieldiae]CAD6604817.1 chain-length determining protein [arsenite-oxidising bacterium NT-25]CCF18960.1 putative transmembrane succinoglycan biosynthesis transport protein [Pseudorhizobium banfieldiae]